jgi:catalase
MASSSHNGKKARTSATAAGSPDAGQDQAGEFLTTAQGLRLPDTDHSLKAGERGPTLLEDFQLREKITHFDHERIPERVVHARGAAAHGTFESYGTGRSVTKAGFLAGKGLRTEVFVRFSTVLGSRGSADTVRDTRGFAVKFYTPEGNFDLVGNNMPVFFIQDGIKFPDVIHAAKPHSDREIPQAQSAHDTFWDFASLHTEATHHVMWNMSDRGIPRSYRTMEGFGVHTFRLVNAAGETHLVKFHWKPAAGVHSLVWEEAQIAAGVDPDFHRRDMADGIEVTNDPLMQARLFSYLDTQLTRLGGPNFTQLPVNRAHCPVNDMLRDGMHQTAVPAGLAPYRPNSIDGGEPLVATAEDGGYVQTPRPVAGPVIRSSPVSFGDHFTQPAMFCRSLTPLEQAHIVEAFTFELGKCYEQAIKERELQVLANVDADLAGIGSIRKAARKLGATALVIAPVGGVLGNGSRTETVDRTLLTTRSVEFDALVVAGGTTPTGDIKLTVLLQEAFRHCKALGAWGDGTVILEAAGIFPGAPGVVTSGAAGKSFTEQLAAAVGLHRAWDRAPAVMASAIPPVLTSR